MDEPFRDRLHPDIQCINPWIPLHLRRLKRQTTSRPHQHFGSLIAALSALFGLCKLATWVSMMTKILYGPWSPLAVHHELYYWTCHWCMILLATGNPYYAHFFVPLLYSQFSRFSNFSCIYFFVHFFDLHAYRRSKKMPENSCSQYSSLADHLFEEEEK